MEKSMIETKQLGLYDPAYEHDACGIGFVASIKGIKSHQKCKRCAHHFRKYGAQRC